MKLEEAIEILRNTPIIDIRNVRDDDIRTLYATAQMMAIDAPKTVQGLNEIGAVEVFESVKVILHEYQQLQQQLKQYREIGTVEECKEAVEKQEPREPKAHESIVCGVHTYLCPYCERYIGSSMERVPKYCEWCGQAIDTENLEEMKDE